LTGSLPSMIGLMTNLNFMLLHNNLLTGTIPTEIGLMTSLNFLSLNGNSISGTIPSNILNLTSILKISVYNTSIDRDSIPSSFFSMLVEPCIICNGEDSYDFVKSIDESVISWADECAEKN